MYIEARNYLCITVSQYLEEKCAIYLSPTIQKLLKMVEMSWSLESAINNMTFEVVQFYQVQKGDLKVVYMAEKIG